MKGYFFHTPRLIRWFYPDFHWKVLTREQALFLTFDDGPEPEVTPHILRLLHDFQARATFFCIGEQMKKYPELVREILDAGHAIGNHTDSHPNGWKTKSELYLRDIRLFDEVYRTRLFRPPHGQVTPTQSKLLRGRKVVMWTHMAGDFDESLNAERSLKNLLKAKPGSILVFHDSVKAYKNLEVLLPEVLRHFSRLGYIFKSIEETDHA